VNITGGADLTLGEVHQINEIIHEAVGDDAEIIFGAVHEPAMQGEIRVTVIATGFDKPAAATPQPVLPVSPIKGAPVIPLPTSRTARPGVTPNPVRPPQPGIPDISRRVTPINPLSSSNDGRDHDLSDMEIPTFIRRQMD
jgi:cell division protein FtsZ